jgi:hypothetical protein
MHTRREFLSFGTLFANSSAEPGFADIVRRSNLIQQINKHDSVSGCVYIAEIYRHTDRYYWLISGELAGPNQDLKAAFIAAELDLSRLKYRDPIELAQEIERITGSEHSRFLDTIVSSIL